MTTSSVRPHNGVPSLFVNDRHVPSTVAFITSRFADTFLRSGIELYTYWFHGKWWVGPDTYDFAEFDAWMSEYFDRLPTGYFMPRVDLAPQGAPLWGEANPSEMVVARDIATGKVVDPTEYDPRAEDHLHHAVHLKGLNLHSYHSLKWRADAGKAIAALIQHVDQGPYAERIWAWHICDGWPQEWFHWGQYLLQGLEDYSPAARADFQRWVRHEYGNDPARLRAAWGREISFDRVELPEPAERVRLTHGEFYDPVRDRPTVDYTQCLNDSVVDSIIAVCGAAKQAMRDPKIVCAYYGYPFCHLPRPQLNGHNGVARILASETVDVLASPHSYDHRGEGGYHSPQSVADTVRRAGKIHFDEVDCKTIWTPQVRWKDNIRQPATVESTIEMMKKDGAYHIASASAMWWMDLFSQGWFESPETIKVFVKMKALEQRVFASRPQAFGEVALVVSERSQMFQAQKDGLIDASREMFRNWHLSRMGAPFEQLLLTDLKYADLPRYKLYIMADLYYLSAEERALLERVVKRNHATVLWVYAPGFMDDQSAALENMQMLTGIRFGMQDKYDELNVQLTRFDHPITQGLTGTRYGTGVDRAQYLEPSSMQFLPDTRVKNAFYADDPTAEVLGIAESTGQAGLVVKDMGSWRSVYSAAPVLSWQVMRNLARWAGVHLYSDVGDMVWGNDKFLCIYSQSEGVHNIRFPKAMDIEEGYEDRTLGRNVNELALPMKRWQTHLLVMEAS